MMQNQILYYYHVNMVDYVKNVLLDGQKNREIVIFVDKYKYKIIIKILEN